MCVVFFPQAASCAAAFFCDFRDFCVTFKFAAGKKNICRRQRNHLPQAKKKHLLQAKKETLATGEETTCRGQR